MKFGMYLALKEQEHKSTESSVIASAINAATLESAFNAFNEQSVLLEKSYRELQGKVLSLTEKLNESQTARHRELLEKESLSERLAQTLEALPGAIVVLDNDGTIRECNAQAATLLNQPLLGRPWSEIAKREFMPVGNADGELQLNDGRVLSLQRRRLGPGQGEILLLTDVSESRRMTDMLARHQRLSAIGEMTARLAHQIRTPLASALLYASQMTPGDGSAASPGGKVVARLRELDRMVNDMLQFAGGSQHDDESIDVAELLADVAETGAVQLAGRTKISVNVDDSQLRIAGNRGALKGALCNLLENALTACGTGGSVELGAWRDANSICLAVSDDGHGIPDDQLTQVFEPFFTTRPQGTGLGLAVVRSVADAHDAEVLLTSGRDGTTVGLRLPAAAVPQRLKTTNRGYCHA